MNSYFHEPLDKEKSFDESEIDFQPPLEIQNLDDNKIFSSNNTDDENSCLISDIKIKSENISDISNKRRVISSHSPGKNDPDESSLTQKPSNGIVSSFNLKYLSFIVDYSHCKMWKISEIWVCCFEI